MINYAVVGVGGFAATWIRSLEQLQSQGLLRLAAVTEIQRSRYAGELQRLADAGVHIYPSFEEMLAESDPTHSVIGLPVGIPIHAELALQALRAGYNVHVEKPIAPVIQQVHEIRRACDETGRWCAVGYQFIYSPTIQWLRARLREGTLGRIIEARGVTGWPRAASYYVRNGWAGRIRSVGRWVLDGPATNAVAHYLTNLLYLCSAQVEDVTAAIERVRAELYRAKPIESYDTSCLEIDMAGGSRVLHVATHATAQSLEPVMDILCEQGTIHWEARSDAAVIRYYADGHVETFANPEPENIHSLPFQQVARVAAGEEPLPLCGPSEALAQVLAINLAFESSGGVRTIASEHTCVDASSPADELVTIAGIDPLLLRAENQGQTFAQSGAPWAEPGAPISAANYSHFPSEALGRMLASA
ncbi:MAG: Gfo/Idh/MocA family oxidoreductase [Anaerolineae bacterium]|nr:Gfo/Idh/MocA family oxidoreductase [Anaerolineae bacterium]